MEENAMAWAIEYPANNETGEWKRSKILFVFKSEATAAVAGSGTPGLRVVETEDPATHRYMYGDFIPVEEIIAIIKESEKAEAARQAARASHGPWFRRSLANKQVEDRDMGFRDVKGRAVGMRIVRQDIEWIEDPGGPWMKEETDHRFNCDIYSVFDGRRTSTAFFYDWAKSEEKREQSIETAIEDRVHDLKKRAKLLPPEPPKVKLADRLRELAGRLTERQDVDFINELAERLSGKRKPKENEA
jgi:hypothetical protein